MDRRERITKHVSMTAVGVEIGPWHNPLTPKAMGYNCLVMDVFDSETLFERADADGTINAEMRARIEPVDLVGTSSEIEHLVEKSGLLGRLNYVISSHNFEHIPDPIRFLKGCERALVADGVLSMAIPDRRGCFDFFRTNSNSAQFIEAYFAGRTRPSEVQVFEQGAFTARFVDGLVEHLGFPTDSDPLFVIPYEKLRDRFDVWQRRNARGDADYLDAHCWTFTPSSFELILADLNFLGLTRMSIEEIEPFGGEFHVHLRNKGDKFVMPEPREFYQRRRELLLRINDECAVTSSAYQALVKERQSVRDVQNLQDSDRQRTASENAELHDLIRQRDAEIASLRSENAKLARQYTDIESSTTWRMTAPVRKIMGSLHRPPRNP